jgi:hypothetical protein
VVLLGLITVIAMVCQDTFATTMVVAEARNLAHWPGLMDGLNDYASRIGGAVTAGSYVHSGLWSWQTQTLLALTAVTSYCTTNRVTGIAHRLLPPARPSKEDS